MHLTETKKKDGNNHVFNLSHSPKHRTPPWHQQVTHKFCSCDTCFSASWWATSFFKKKNAQTISILPLTYLLHHTGFFRDYLTWVDYVFVLEQTELVERGSSKLGKIKKRKKLLYIFKALYCEHATILNHWTWYLLSSAICVPDSPWHSTLQTPYWSGLTKPCHPPSYMFTQHNWIGRAIPTSPFCPSTPKASVFP